MATPGPEETAAEKESEGGDARQAPGGAQEGAKGPKKEDAPAPVACVTGVPKEYCSLGSRDLQQILQNQVASCGGNHI